MAMTYPYRFDDRGTIWIAITTAYSPNGVPLYASLCVRDHIPGRLVAWFMRFLMRYQIRIARHDAITLGMKDGDYFPWWSLSYWWGKPLIWANKFLTRMYV